MLSLRTMLALTLTCLTSPCAAQQTYKDAVARSLGPQWKQLSRTAGHIFSGTVLGIEALPAQNQAVPMIQVRFRVDRGIIGAQTGQILTIREWAGAWSMHRPLRVGQRLLLFLHPASRLGLTSPVGGSLGLFALDAKGEVISPAAAIDPRQGLALGQTPPVAPAATPGLSWPQLERAIRRAREE